MPSKRATRIFRSIPSLQTMNSAVCSWRRWRKRKPFATRRASRLDWLRKTAHPMRKPKPSWQRCEAWAMKSPPLMPILRSLIARCPTFCSAPPTIHRQACPLARTKTTTSKRAVWALLAILIGNPSLIGTLAQILASWILIPPPKCQARALRFIVVWAHAWNAPSSTSF